MRRIAALLLPLLAAACTTPVQIQQFTAGDLQQAAAVAQAGGDDVGAACWGKWLAPVQALQAGAPLGLATKIEIVRVAEINLSSPACAPISVMVLMELNKLKLPLLGLGLAGGPVVGLP
jgi:hypothetical protein